MGGQQLTIAPPNSEPRYYESHLPNFRILRIFQTYIAVVQSILAILPSRRRQYHGYLLTYSDFDSGDGNMVLRVILEVGLGAGGSQRRI